jgi:hypothetical protein
MADYNPNWYGILKILEFKHLDVDGKILYEEKNILNILHNSGESFILSSCFAGGEIPATYYFGMDSRLTLTATDDMTLLEDYETSGFGYLRQQIPSSGVNSFNITFENSHYKATSPPVQFSAIGGTWGPVQNLFMTNKSDYSGNLISSAALLAPVSVTDGQSIIMRLGLSLKDCPPST